MPRLSIALPAPAPGARHTLAVYRYGRSGARPKAYFQAAIHADETPALLTAHHLLRLLEQAESEGRITGEVIVTPVANPIGLSQRLNGYLLGRFDFSGSGNFNRDFLELPDRALSDQLVGKLGNDAEANVALIRQALRQAVAEHRPLKEIEVLKLTLLGFSIDADLVFDLHCDSEALLHLYAAVHHCDAARELGADLGARVILLEQNTGSVPFDEANAGPWWKLRERLGDAGAIPLACCAVTVELRGAADVADAYARQDAANLFRFLQRQGVIAGDPGPLPAALCEPTPLEGVDIPAAPAAGVIVYQRELGDWVGENELLAELVDPLADDPNAARTPIYSRTRGLLFTRLAAKLVQPGQSLCKIAGAAPLPHRQFGKLLQD